MAADEQPRAAAVGQPRQAHRRQPLGIAQLLARHDEELLRTLPARLPRIGIRRGRLGEQSADLGRQRFDFRRDGTGFRGIVPPAPRQRTVTRNTSAAAQTNWDPMVSPLPVLDAFCRGRLFVGSLVEFTTTPVGWRLPVGPAGTPPSNHRSCCRLGISTPVACPRNHLAAVAQGTESHHGENEQHTWAMLAGTSARPRHLTFVPHSLR